MKLSLYPLNRFSKLNGEVHILHKLELYELHHRPSPILIQLFYLMSIKIELIGQQDIGQEHQTART